MVKIVIVGNDFCEFWCCCYCCVWEFWGEVGLVWFVWCEEWWYWECWCVVMGV